MVDRDTLHCPNVKTIIVFVTRFKGGGGGVLGQICFYNVKKMVEKVTENMAKVSLQSATLQRFFFVVQERNVTTYN